MTDVFISYQRAQRVDVEAIAAALRDIELNVWFDRELAAGADFPKEIEAIAGACKAMIVCWTPLAVKSAWVQKEASIGRSRNVLVPVFLAPCSLPTRFSNLNAPDLSQWRMLDDEPWLKVLARLEVLIGREDLVTKSRTLANGRKNGLVARVRSELVRLARIQKTTDYKAMAELVGVDQPTLWAALDATAEENRSRREPPLCALVVSAGTEIPGNGYFQKHAFLKGDFDPLAKAVWEGHCQRVWARSWNED